MAFTGETIRLKGTFYNFADALADPTSVTLKIYDGKRTLIATYDPTRESLGVYYYDYLVPATGIEPLSYEFSGTLEGTTALGRAVIDREWI